MAIDGAVLVTAGAGTGKTRLLTHRIAYLIEKLKINPYNILAITFTNKAANEMKTRVQKLVDGGDRVWISTFHSMCVKMLRQDIDKLNEGYDRNFTIYSDTDSEKLLKQILKEYGIDDDYKNYAYHISNCKNKNMTIGQYEKEYKNIRNIDEIIKVFREYQSNLEKNNALDFDDLLSKTYELFEKCPEVLDFYARRFMYVLVDEFQDTNKIQYDLTKMLSSFYNNLFVVGDEDQSIYSWRGADFTNIFNISKDFLDTKIFKLQQNYRCTKDILKSANSLIKYNDERFDKKLWTNKENDERVVYKKYYDEQEEAEGVAGTIYRLVNSGKCNYSDIAILVRLNALTMHFEEKLLSYNIPYKIYGGFKFFERTEIKNILSYLRIFVNPKDEVSLLRIINFPKRGIGDAAISSLKELADNNGISVLEVINDIEKYTNSAAIINKIKNFGDIYKELLSTREELSLYDFAIKVIEKYKIKEEYKDDDDENVDKLMNIDQLVSSIGEYVKNNPESTLLDYLESVTLQADIDTMDNSNNVTVATVHSVKGLEFKVVFVVGMEDGIFPLSRCKDSDRDLQEERRLAYVAFTRAGEQLYVSSCQTRFIYGKRNYEKISQFIEEAGLELEYGDLFDRKSGCEYYGENVDYMNKYSYTNNCGYNTKTNISTYIPKPQNNKYDDFESNKNVTIDVSKYKVGQIVGHTKFGVGTIISIGDGGKTADIDFGGLGKKTLMLEIAPLKIIKN